MKRVGMLVAVEMEALHARYGEPLERLREGGFELLRYENGDYELIAVNAGAGELGAAAATQLLISAFHVDLVLNFGVVGGLTPEMALARTCVVERVVHYDFDTSDWDGCEPGRYLAYPTPFLPASPELVEKALTVAPELKKVTCASADKFVGSAEKKRALHERWGADICEMEAAGIVLTCSRAGVPCLLIKAVSDAMTGGAEEFSRELRRSADLALEVADRIIREL